MSSYLAEKPQKSRLFAVSGGMLMVSYERAVKQLGKLTFYH